jgi:site-specific DNA-methyltransferase (adenine-specific)
MSLLLGDCLDLMAALPERSVDLVLTDPPYGITDRAKFPTNNLAVDWPAWWREVKRVCKPDAVVVLITQQPLTTVVAASNLDSLRYSLVAVNNRATGFQLAKVQPLTKHYDILVFGGRRYNPQGLLPCHKVMSNKNKTGTNYNGLRNFHGQNYHGLADHEYVQTQTNYPMSVLHFKSVHRRVHATQKPVELLSYLIKTYSDEGQCALDPFAGSGSTGIAAACCGRRFVGMELDPAVHQKALIHMDAELGQ